MLAFSISFCRSQNFPSPLLCWNARCFRCWSWQYVYAARVSEMNLVIAWPTAVSSVQWKIDGARNPKVWGSIPRWDSELVILCHKLVTRRKHITYKISLKHVLVSSIWLFTLKHWSLDLGVQAYVWECYHVASWEQLHSISWTRNIRSLLTISASAT